LGHVNQVKYGGLGEFLIRNWKSEIHIMYEGNISPARGPSGFQSKRRLFQVPNFRLEQGRCFVITSD
jgi:hypothetical protein